MKRKCAKALTFVTTVTSGEHYSTNENQWTEAYTSLHLPYMSDGEGTTEGLYIFVPERWHYPNCEKVFMFTTQ